jgi:hypothetical protein
MIQDEEVMLERCLNLWKKIIGVLRNDSGRTNFTDIKEKHFRRSSVFGAYFPK